MKKEKKKLTRVEKVITIFGIITIILFFAGLTFIGIFIHSLNSYEWEPTVKYIESEFAFKPTKLYSNGTILITNTDHVIKMKKIQYANATIMNLNKLIICKDTILTKKEYENTPVSLNNCSLEKNTEYFVIIDRNYEQLIAE